MDEQDIERVAAAVRAALQEAAVRTADGRALVQSGLALDGLAKVCGEIIASVSPQDRKPAADATISAIIRHWRRVQEGGTSVITPLPTTSVTSERLN